MDSCLLVEDTSICNSRDHKNERVGSTVLFTVVICLFEKKDVGGETNSEFEFPHLTLKLLD